jgi:hypothetical protein
VRAAHIFPPLCNIVVMVVIFLTVAELLVLTPSETVPQSVNRLEDSGPLVSDDGLFIADYHVRETALLPLATSAGVSPLDSVAVGMRSVTT